jgi:plasmid maintenance system antidote protein VapI
MVGGMNDLSAYLETCGRTQLAVAAELGISQGHLNDMKTGRRKPGRELAVRIERMLGVPVQSWDCVA